jgi:hypothetical protein
MLPIQPIVCFTCLKIFYPIKMLLLLNDKYSSIFSYDKCLLSISEIIEEKHLPTST